MRSIACSKIYTVGSALRKTSWHQWKRIVSTYLSILTIFTINYVDCMIEQVNCWPHILLRVENIRMNILRISTESRKIRKKQSIVVSPENGRYSHVNGIILYWRCFFFIENSAMEVQNDASNSAISFWQSEKSWNIPIAILFFIRKLEIACRAYALKGHIPYPIVIFVNWMFR